MGILKFTAIYLGTVIVSFPLMVWGAVSLAEWYQESKVEATQVGPDGSGVYVSNHGMRTGRTVVVIPEPDIPQPVKVKSRKTKTKKRVVRWKGKRTSCNHLGHCYDRSNYGYGSIKRVKVMRPDGTYPED